MIDIFDPMLEFLSPGRQDKIKTRKLDIIIVEINQRMRAI